MSKKIKGIMLLVSLFLILFPLKNQTILNSTQNSMCLSGQSDITLIY